MNPPPEPRHPATPLTRYPTRFQQRTLWNAATGVSILILGILTVGLIWLTGKVFGFLQPVLIPIIVAGIIAYVLDPVVRFLEKRRLSRLWAIVSVYLALLLGITLLVAAVLPGVQRSRESIRQFLTPANPPAATATTDTPATQPATENPDAAATTASPDPSANGEARLPKTLARSLHQLRQEHSGNPIGWLLTETGEDGKALPESTDPAAEPESLDFFWQTRAGRTLYQSKDQILRTGRDWLTAGSSKLLGFIGLAVGFIMVPIYLFFFLKDSASIRDHWHDYVPLKASRFKTELVSTLSEINGYLISFFRGQVVVAIIDGLLVGVALTLFGLPYGFLIGIFMAILGVIPYIGNILCLIPACIIAYLHAQGSTEVSMSPWAYVGTVVVIFVAVQQINSLVTAPKIVGDSVGLHPLTVIFSMLFWSLVLGGFVGALLAVPLTAAIKVLFRRYIWERRIREA